MITSPSAPTEAGQHAIGRTSTVHKVMGFHPATFGGEPYAYCSAYIGKGRVTANPVTCKTCAKH